MNNKILSLYLRNTCKKLRILNPCDRVINHIVLFDYEYISYCLYNKHLYVDDKLLHQSFSLV